MTISYNWLKDWLPAAQSADITSQILTAIGLEVEGMENVEAIPGGLAGVFTAKVLTCQPHPDSDHLHITSVDAGGEQPIQIVCGAPNVEAGQKVLLATIGTVLHFSNGEEVKIKKSKIRGIESFGMICAEDELGIGQSHEGIMVLPQDTPVGIAAKDYLNLASDTIFEIGLTPNRIDAASHLGVARDLVAYYASIGSPICINRPSIDAFKEGTEQGVDVVVEAPEAALRYSGLTLNNVKVAESPQWLKDKLTAIGLHPINNVVDITNYILFDLGQPLHAFDRSKIKGDKVVVRFAKQGENFVTLDGVSRKLDSSDLMICNQEQPMCMAGVFGGLDSGVTAQTTSVFLESAYFHPVFIRKTSKRHGLKTDASFRYERGTDPDMVPFALRRAALLLQEIAGAVIESPVRDIYPNPVTGFKVSLNYSRMFALMGKNIGREKVETIMKALVIKILSSDENGAEVVVPPYRVDVQRECDVVEDVLRIYGYNNIELPSSVHASVNHTTRPDSTRMLDRVSDFLADKGFREIMCNSLTKGQLYNNFTTFPAEKCVRILNPLSADLNVMRQSLIFGALEAIAYNINRQQYDLKLFETGHVYTYNAAEDSAENAANGQSLKAYSENQCLAVFMTGLSIAQQWRLPQQTSDFFALKSIVEQIIASVGGNAAILENREAPSDLFVEGVELVWKGQILARLGKVGKNALKLFAIKQDVYAAEIYWKTLFSLVKNNKVLFKELPRFPEVRRDLALVVDRKVSYSQLQQAAQKAERKVLRRVQLFDVYEGNKLPEGKKQYALSFYLQDPDKTMTDNYVEVVMNRIFTQIQKETDAILR